jgi:hypothetical protein
LPDGDSCSTDYFDQYIRTAGATDGVRRHRRAARGRSLADELRFFVRHRDEPLETPWNTRRRYDK